VLSGDVTADLVVLEQLGATTSSKDASFDVDDSR
jgi:hypothetical protein